ncbi:unnamed protein product [Mytilus coruscus]|uniref:SMP-30/Gluconolactonase/LRE-like region domain-containing protein n=1 Tax=Mytilus coruscus TaxID=42192 RepID=A0A6J8EB62_MYTCO|nr:unnamed protein product [Mytilus coruscus]
MLCEAFDIVYINEDNALAVTSGGSVKTCITIIDLEKKQIKKTISLESNSYGIALKDIRLIYSGYDKEIRMMNMYDESISTIVQDIMPIDGEIQWTFQNENVLKSPRGIDVDSDGSVFVAGSSSNNVVVIAPDGKRHREVLTGSDSLNDPVSLHYRGPQKQLLVANFHNKAHLFNIN